MPDAQFHFKSSRTVREVIAKGILPELEYGLLNEHGKALRWTTAEKARFCNMAIDTLEAHSGSMTLEVQVRSFCHAADVTSDYLTLEERFNTRQTILVVGNVGLSPAPWANLIQPAVYLHIKGFNIVSVEIPSLATSTPRWLKYGPAVIKETLEFMKIRSVCTLACDNGGAIFLEAMGLNRGSFGATHFVFNIDCPPGTKKAPFPVFKLEESLREANLQFWFGFNDEDSYNHLETGTTPRKSYDAVMGMQARLEGERRRGRRSLDYDEVLISEQLNREKTKHVKRVRLGRVSVIVFSDEVLNSLHAFFEHPPHQTQDDLTARGGLAIDMKSLGATGEELTELPALQWLRLDDAGKAAMEEAAKRAAEQAALDGANVEPEVRPLIQLALDARERPLPMPSQRYLQDRMGLLEAVEDEDEEDEGQQEWDELENGA